jgi:hypothetical protein
LVGLVSNISDTHVSFERRAWERLPGNDCPDFLQNSERPPHTKTNYRQENETCSCFFGTVWIILPIQRDALAEVEEAEVEVEEAEVEEAEAKVEEAEVAEEEEDEDQDDEDEEEEDEVAAGDAEMEENRWTPIGMSVTPIGRSVTAK